MKRPMLISGITVMITAGLLIILPKALYALIGICALVLFLYLLKPLNLRKHIIIPAVCIFSILLCISLSVYNAKNITPLIKYDNTSSYISGKVITSPAETTFGKKEFILQADKINGEKVKTNVNIKISSSEEFNIELFDYISIENCELEIGKNESFDYDLTAFSDNTVLTGYGEKATKLWECEKTLYYHCLHLKENISQKISAFMNDSQGGLLKGMLFGDKTDMDSEVGKAFRNSGIAHLLAVSGLHTGLWCSILISLLSVFNIPEKIRNIICIIFLSLFVIISAFTPSVLRASLMMLIVLIAPFFNRRADSLNSLGFAVTLLILSNPYILLSISFQLSVASTFGVLLSLPLCRKVNEKCSKLKEKHLVRFTKFITSSLIISLFSMLFTLPVSAFYFGVWSILSPLANILCVQLAFYAMVTGLIGIGLSFIKIAFIKDIAIVIFNVTEFLSDIVISIAKSISDITWCTIPVHKEWLIYGLILSAIFISSGYALYKIKKNRRIIQVTASVSVLSLIILIFIPLLSPAHRNTVAIVSSGNNVQVVIRSGLRYAYISNSHESNISETSDFLPKATSEALSYYFATYLSANSLTDIEKVSRYYSPEETHITEYIRKYAVDRDIPLPENTLISTTGKFPLSSKITFQIVDTYPMEYVIINRNDEIIFIHLHGDVDFSKVKNSENIDIMVFNNTIPDDILNAEKVIINSDTRLLDDECTGRLKDICDQVYFTAKDGSIVL